MDQLRIHFVACTILLAALFGAVAPVCAAETGEASATPSPPDSVALPSPRLTLESIAVEPPDRETEILVERHFPLRVGQAVDPADLVEARERLTATGLFTDVDIYTTRGTRRGAVNAVVAAKPSRRFTLETGLGFEPPRGWYLNIIGVRRTGLFHRGGTARLSFRTALRTSGLFGEMEVPGVVPHHLDLLLDAAGFGEEWIVYDRDKSYYQTLDRAHAHVGLRRQLQPETRLTLRLGASRVRPEHNLMPYDDTPKIPADSLLPAPSGTLGFFDAETGLFRDRLDRQRPWQKGSWTGLMVRGSVPGRGPAFWGWDLDLRAAFPVFRTSAAAFRLRAAGTDPGTPYYLRPVVGGTGSLRGFAPGALSGPLGARALWQASAEWRQPLVGDDPARPRVLGTIYVDVGDHWTSSGGLYGISASVGYGALFRVRWLQTVNFEVAFPLTDDPTGSPVAVRLGLGRSF